MILAQPYRAIDGMGNNLADPDWGAAGTNLRRRMLADYTDDVFAMWMRENPRTISNIVAAQDGNIPNTEPVSDMVWQWGQFLDHDIDLTTTNPAEPVPILLHPSDPLCRGGGMGGSSCTIPFHRSIHDASTGTGTDNPRQQPNVITSYIDASNVYGSNADTAVDLRTNDGTGRLRISGDNLLPMEGGMFLAGDIRANEQIGLTAMHTLFMREHNRLADLIALEHPGMPGEQIYQRARKIVGAEMQKITYDEFLPALLGASALDPYTGYESNVNATIMNLFATAAYRFGHSMLSPSLLLIHEEGKESFLPLRDAFFSPGLIQDGSDLEAILRGLYTQTPQEVDTFLVDGVRNFLFGGGSFGLDLAALNIQRGRDHGLPPYNAVRAAMELTPAGSFTEVSSDPLVQARLTAAYASVDTIDAWVGGLAEDHVSGALVGELIFTVLVEQFEALRDGDRYWHQRPGVLTPSERAMVEAMTLAVIIRNNTGIDGAPADVFHVD